MDRGERRGGPVLRRLVVQARPRQQGAALLGDPETGTGQSLARRGPERIPTSGDTRRSSAASQGRHAGRSARPGRGRPAAREEGVAS
ncbi:hypothetical protein [Streptomyces griseoluteus]|uniref:hypothetical protein n=1 Tax=Streptomyces griseoluteus TaxID=29306 RepID=UPI003691F762